jgi:hypothetical protein
LEKAPGTIYNGDKKRDGVKTIHLIGPDGNCLFARGLFIGPKHDASCFREAGLHVSTWTIWASHSVRCYGDSAFPRSDAMWTNFKQNQATQDELRHQAKIQEARAEIEHFFSVMVNNWKLLSNTGELKVGARPLGDFIFCATFFTNCLNCVWPNQISQKFSLRPPMLAEYLAYCASRLEL